MTNADLQAFFDLYKDRMYAIDLDNTRKIYIGYPEEYNGVRPDQVTLETIGGVDYIRVDRVVYSQSTPVHVSNFHLTETVQWLGVVEPDSEGLLPDPLLFR